MPNGNGSKNGMRSFYVSSAASARPSVLIQIQQHRTILAPCHAGKFRVRALQFVQRRFLPAELRLLAANLLGQTAVFQQHGAVFQRPFDGELQIVAIPRFWEETVDFGLIDRRKQRLPVGVAAQNQPHGVWLYRPEAGQKRHAIHPRHAIVREHQVEGGGLGTVQCRLGAVEGFDLVARTCQQAHQCTQYIRFVIYQHDAVHRFSPTPLCESRIHCGRPDPAH